MSQPNLVELAKAGDPHAIAKLINSALSKDGLKAEIEKIEQRLKIVVYGNSVPDRLKATSLIQDGVMKLKPIGISDVAIVGRVNGAKVNKWVREFSLTSQPQNSSSTSTFKIVGIVGLVFSSLMLLGALLYDTSIDDTHNIGRISERDAWSEVGSAIAICSTVLLVYGDFQGQSKK